MVSPAGRGRPSGSSRDATASVRLTGERAPLRRRQRGRQGMGACFTAPGRAGAHVAHPCTGCRARRSPAASAGRRCPGSGRRGAAAWRRQTAPCGRLRARACVRRRPSTCSTSGRRWTAAGHSAGAVPWSALARPPQRMSCTSLRMEMHLSCSQPFEGPGPVPVQCVTRSGLHDPAPIVRVRVHARVKLVRPGRHARVKVRVRDGDRPHAAQLVQVRFGILVEHGDAVPQDIALACARRGQ